MGSTAHFLGFPEFSNSISTAASLYADRSLLGGGYTSDLSDVDDQNVYETLLGSATDSHLQQREEEHEPLITGNRFQNFDIGERSQSCDYTDIMNASSSSDRVAESSCSLRLIHLLLAAAEFAASHKNTLSDVILQRIDKLTVTRTSTIQRVAFYLSSGLRSRIHGFICPLGSKRYDFSSDETLAAFQVLHEWTPYIRFSHFTANQAILESVKGHQRVHVLDYDIMDGSQWSSFMCSFVSRNETLWPNLHLSITAIEWSDRSSSLVETGQRLSDFAASMHLSFTFNYIKVSPGRELALSALKLCPGETLVANCMIHLPHLPYRAAWSVHSFFTAMKELRPKIMAVAEEDLGCSTDVPFVYHFLNSFHYYSTLTESLDASLSGDNFIRKVVETKFLAPSITSSVAFGGSFLQPAETLGDYTSGKRRWSGLLRSLGFKCVPLSSTNYCQAKLLLSLHCDGFDAVMEEDRLLLRWHSRGLFAASVWSCGCS